MIRKEKVNILRYLPDFLSKDNILKKVSNTQSDEHEKLRLLLKDLLDNLFIDTATWGLKYWEELLSVNFDIEDYSTRRLKIKILLNSHEVSTLKFMIDLSNRFISDKSAFIVEHNEESYFEIEFNNRSIFDFEGLKKAIELYKPAHLGVKYFALQELKSNIYTYGYINIAEQIELEAETGYSIDPVEASFFVGGLINIASSRELDFDTNIGTRNVNLDSKAILFGKSNNANTIEI